jgi:hypothetical protein
MIGSVVLAPGDTVRFKRGSQFSGPLQILDSGTESAPIVLTAYGDGGPPAFTNPDDTNMNGNCIRISGEWIVLDGLHFHDTPGTKTSDRLQSIFLMGAVLIMTGANHNTIRNCSFTRCTQGIESEGEYTLITSNTLDGPDTALWNVPGENAGGSWGPLGIHLGVGNQEVSYNRITNYLTLDSVYGEDGGAIEIDDGRFHKDNLYIHHNRTHGNAGFIELAWLGDYNPRVQEAHNLRVAFNQNVDGHHWLNIGAPCHDCYFDNNTVIRNTDFGGPFNLGVTMDFSGIHFRNNLFVYTADEFFVGDAASGGEMQSNWYFDQKSPPGACPDANAAGSGDPGLVVSPNGDFGLCAASRLRGLAVNLEQRYSVDLSGSPLRASGPWDVGAFQLP